MGRYRWRQRHNDNQTRGGRYGGYSGLARQNLWNLNSSKPSAEPLQESIIRPQPKQEPKPEAGIKVCRHDNATYVLRVQDGKLSVLGRSAGEEMLYVMATTSSKNYPDSAKLQFALAVAPDGDRYILWSKDEVHAMEPKMRGGGRYRLVEALGEEEQKAVGGQLRGLEGFYELELVVEKLKPPEEVKKGNGSAAEPVRLKGSVGMHFSGIYQRFYAALDTDKELVLLGRVVREVNLRKEGKRWADSSLGEIGVIYNIFDDAYMLQNREQHLGFLARKGEDVLFMKYIVVTSCGEGEGKRVAEEILDALRWKPRHDAYAARVMKFDDFGRPSGDSGIFNLEWYSAP